MVNGRICHVACGYYAERCDREAVRGKQTGRTIEISRLLGRSLRQCVDLAAMKGHTIVVDCDVLNADGGTRCASINGAVLVLQRACAAWVEAGLLKENPFRQAIFALGAGVVDGEPVLDMNYQQDSQAEFDLNVVLSQTGELIEIQGTAERKPLTIDRFTQIFGQVKAAAVAYYS